METTTPVSVARAFSYVRVSSDGQTKTDYSDDGLSIDAQRGGAADKAAQLGAEIVQEFSDAGRSAYVDLHKRVGFLDMLEELKRLNANPATRIDYVIVWDLSRYARNIADHFQCNAIIKKAGARLVSITEPIAGEDSPAAFLYEGVVATFNQFQSMQTAEKVRGGLKQKASVGGTYGWAPLGYVHTVDRLADGRRVRTVEVDPERGHFMTVAFQLYDSGEYSLSQLADELNRLGLATRPTPKRSARPMTISTLQRLLRNRYYAGFIVYKRGKSDEQVFPGRHTPLIDVETFERVQLMLDSKRLAGDRSYRRTHYLKGSVFCGRCGRRLVYALTTGRNGTKYPYFFCQSRNNHHECTMRFNIAPHKIEAAVAQQYGTMQLSPAQVEKAKTAIRSLAEESEGALQHIRLSKTQLIAKLEQQQDKLLDLHFEDSISEDVFKRRQTKLEVDLHAARTSLVETERKLVIDQAQLERALELAGDVCAAYLAADETTRRAYNQAFFKKLLVDAESEPGERQPSVAVSGVELSQPYALLLAKDLVRQIATEVDSFGENRSQNRNRADKIGPVSIFEQLVPLTGREPDPSTVCCVRFATAVLERVTRSNTLSVI